MGLKATLFLHKHFWNPSRAVFYIIRFQELSENPFSGGVSPLEPLSRALGPVSGTCLGCDSVLAVCGDRSQPLFGYGSHPQPALRQKSSLICVRAWEVMALINSGITIWISFSFREKHNHFKALIMPKFLKNPIEFCFHKSAQGDFWTARKQKDNEKCFF